MDEQTIEHCWSSGFSLRRLTVVAAFCRKPQKTNSAHALHRRRLKPELQHPPVSSILSLLCLLTLLSYSNPIDAAERYDIILKNGRIVDGAGTPWYISDLAIRDGKIAAIGRL